MSENKPSTNAQEFGPTSAVEAPAKRQKRRTVQEFPDDFDERAKANSQKVVQLHEFRRENIREFEEPTKDYFQYDPNEPRKYDALKLETIFKFQTTYKSIKWGVAVGSMFAFHRYFRTRDIHAAAHWFTVMSFISFFNIFLSYQLQDFVTEYGSRKSLSMSQSGEYHQTAYKTYVERLQKDIKPISQTMPVLHNSQALALNEFVKNNNKFLHERFGTADQEKDQIISNILDSFKQSESDLTTSQHLQLQVIIKDQYMKDYQRQVEDLDGLIQEAEQVLKNVDAVDLKQLKFDNDPDMNFKNI